MYRQMNADDIRRLRKLPDGYTVDGMLIIGHYNVEKETDRLQRVLQQFKSVTTHRFDDPFFNRGTVIEIAGKRFWYLVAYGGTMLSEYLHVGCMLGSKKNILSGVCGGLKPGAKAGDIILPTATGGDGTTVYMYDRTRQDLQPSDTNLRQSLRHALSSRGYQALEGKTITCQALLAETAEDVQNWSKEGYYGVEMEASTVFAVSNHFDVPSAAILSIADNLIEGDTIRSDSFEAGRQMREAVRDVQCEVALRELFA